METKKHENKNNKTNTQHRTEVQLLYITHLLIIMLQVFYSLWIFFKSLPVLFHLHVMHEVFWILIFFRWQRWGIMLDLCMFSVLMNSMKLRMCSIVQIWAEILLLEWQISLTVRVIFNYSLKKVCLSLWSGFVLSFRIGLYWNKKSEWALMALSL